MRSTIVAVNLALRFFVELGALAGLAYAGWALPDGGITGVVAAVLLVAAGAAIWARYAAPRGPRRVLGWRLLVVELVVIGGAVVLLAVVGAYVAAAVLGTAYVVHRVVSQVTTPGDDRGAAR